jgi:DNA-binding XRE family transcriptional regulator
MAAPGRPRIELEIPEPVLARYTAGEIDHHEVARLCGVSARVALRELRRAGMDTSRSTRRQLQRMRQVGLEDLYQVIPHLYGLGMSLREVGRQFGLTPEGVRQILLRQGQQPRSGPGGVPRRQRSALNSRFALRLRQLRGAAGLTQGELALRSRLSRQTISYLERGTQQPTPETLARLAGALDVDPAALGADVVFTLPDPKRHAEAS